MRNNRVSKVNIHINSNSGTNIIPVDYVAKAILPLTMQNDLTEVNIVHHRNNPHEFFLGRLLYLLGYPEYEFTDTEPEIKNRTEVFYYKTVGKIITDYFCMPEYHFDTSLLMQRTPGLEQPNIMAHLDGIVDFARQNLFKDICVQENEGKILEKFVR
ncbi:MAG: hypothetical protein JXR70_06460 [Spirochaetales bacterium]|nr:hypothetical protein [Spirochaetales bacterium]